MSLYQQLKYSAGQLQKLTREREALWPPPIAFSQMGKFGKPQRHIDKDDKKDAERPMSSLRYCLIARTQHLTNMNEKCTSTMMAKHLIGVSFGSQPMTFLMPLDVPAIKQIRQTRSTIVKILNRSSTL
jgi:hypothetical protein